MNLAVIDCGTNTFNLLIVALNNDGTRTKLMSTRVAVKLGEGLINTTKINDTAFERALDAMHTFSGLISNYGVEKTIAFGTSAIRDAINGIYFVELVKKQFNIVINIIDGNREAELIYLGVKQAVKLTSQISLIMDIGGGSNEFILASNEQIFWKQSFKIGAARLIEKFTPSNPITKAEMDLINNYLEETLAPLFKNTQHYPPIELIGSSGAFDSIIEMIHGELNGEPLTELKTEYPINLDKHFKISELILKSTLDERKKIKGLISIRFDMIVISCLMIDFILKKLNLKTLRVSTYSLKEGALFEFMNEK